MEEDGMPADHDPGSRAGDRSAHPAPEGDHAMIPARPLAVGLTPMETRRHVVLHVATRAEELGYTAFSVGEGWGHDASVLLAEVALRTSRIRLGTGVLNVWGRSPATIAMLASSLAELSGGRFELGLGAGSPSLAEGLHDVPFRRPVQRLGTVARQVRGLLDGERMQPSAAGGARPLRLAVRPPSRIPIQIAALGPEAVRLTGELADAWLPFLLPQSGVKHGMRLLEEGAARRGPDRPLPQFRPGIPVAVCPDPAAARELAAWWVSFYLTTMGPLYARTLRNAGFPEAVDAVLAAGNAAAHSLPASARVLLDELIVWGDADSARAALDGWYDAGAELPAIVLPPGRDLDELDSMLVALSPGAPPGT
jgi:alkanesulfonate monooxygenase SsuD/methylene tetrahydromethanopterin reductase-like flavin-dependent oxidoreductase (luciferase family)